MKVEKKENEAKLREGARKTSVKEGASYGLMDGFGLRYITPYALALNASKFQIGLLSSLPALLGNFSQILTPKFMEKYSRKNIVFFGVFMQTLMWLALIVVGAAYFIYGVSSAGWLVLIYTLLILCGSAVGPAWSSWMKDLIEGINGGEYFGKRGKIAGFIALASMLIAGFLLDYFKHTKIFIGFAIIFFIAFLGRLGSAIYFRKQYEPKFKHEKGYYFSLVDFAKKMHGNNYGRFVFYTALMAFAVNIFSPFSAVYMLEP